MGEFSDCYNCGIILDGKTRLTSRNILKTNKKLCCASCYNYTQTSANTNEDWSFHSWDGIDIIYARYSNTFHAWNDVQSRPNDVCICGRPKQKEESNGKTRFRPTCRNCRYQKTSSSSGSNKVVTWPAFFEWIENILVPSTGQNIKALFVSIRLDPLYASTRTYPAKTAAKSAAMMKNKSAKPAAAKKRNPPTPALMWKTTKTKTMRMTRLLRGTSTPMCFNQLRKGVDRQDGLQELRRGCHTQSYNGFDNTVSIRSTGQCWPTWLIRPVKHRMRCMVISG